MPNEHEGSLLLFTKLNPIKLISNTNLFKRYVLYWVNTIFIISLINQSECQYRFTAGQFSPFHNGALLIQMLIVFNLFL